MTDNQEGPSPPALVRLTAEQCAVCHCGGRDGKVRLVRVCLPVLQRAECSVYPIEAGVANISASAWILVAGKPAFVLWPLRPYVWPRSDGVGGLVSPGWELPVALRHVALVRQLGNGESMREKFVLSLFQELGEYADGMGPECDVFKVAYSLIQRVRVCGRCVTGGCALACVSVWLQG